jgi:hypothetical protein
VEGDAGVAGAGDQEGAEGQAGLEGEREKPEEDWVSGELIGGEIVFEGAGPGWYLPWRGDEVCLGLSVISKMMILLQPSSRIKPGGISPRSASLKNPPSCILSLDRFHPRPLRDT